mmetsp:Transcript_36613/g.81475  ORF Transcript_36613/g.81475 Transcript_36613/m.81475 type:complete len:245 (-) Transcript_36613:3279-4013(-)
MGCRPGPVQVTNWSTRGSLSVIRYKESRAHALAYTKFTILDGMPAFKVFQRAAADLVAHGKSDLHGPAYKILLRMSSSFLSTSPGLRSSSSAMLRCLAAGSVGYWVHRSPSTVSLTGKYEERYAMWSRPHKGGFSCLRCISRCEKKSTSSRDVKGYSAPMQPITVAYRMTSWPPGCRLALCSAVTVSPTWKLMMLSSLCGAPFSLPRVSASLPPVGSSSTCAETLAGSRPTNTLPNLSPPTTVS